MHCSALPKSYGYQLHRSNLKPSLPPTRHLDVAVPVQRGHASQNPNNKKGGSGIGPRSRKQLSNGGSNMKSTSMIRASTSLSTQSGSSSSSSHYDGQRATAEPGSSLVLSEPLSALDVDRELWQVLDLCNDEELEAVYNILHGPSPFSPVVKSMVVEKEPALVELRGRVSLGVQPAPVCHIRTTCSHCSNGSHHAPL